MTAPADRARRGSYRFAAVGGAESLFEQPLQSLALIARKVSQHRLELAGADDLGTQIELHLAEPAEVEIICDALIVGAAGPRPVEKRARVLRPDMRREYVHNVGGRQPFRIKIEHADPRTAGGGARPEPNAEPR